MTVRTEKVATAAGVPMTRLPCVPAVSFLSQHALHPGATGVALVIAQVGRMNVKASISLLVLRNEVPQTGALRTEMYFPTVLGARSPRSRCHQGWFRPRSTKEGSVPGPAPCVVDRRLLPVSSRGLPLSVCKDTSPIGLGPPQ